MIVGLTGLTIIMIFTALGYVTHEHENRISVFALYWHFVDAIWVVVLSVVYFIARYANESVAKNRVRARPWSCR